MSTVNQRLVLHADMDAFFAAIEQRDRPELRGKPVIVGAVSRRGVVAAASYEARKYGVRSAMPGFRARELCPDGVFLASDMEKYSAVSSQVHRVFEEITDVIEPIALDEAFLDITGSVKLFGSALELARRLKQRVREVTELTVSCGIGPNKLVAKIACALGKPDGLKVVTEPEVPDLLAPLPIRRLWGIGPVTERALASLGLVTLGDLARAELRALRTVLGDRAEELRERARGHDDRPVESHRAAKSYGEENTFEHDVRSRSEITAAITSHAEAIAARLRKDSVAGRTVTLKCKLATATRTRAARVPGAALDDEPSYPLVTRSKTLTRATNDAATLRKVAITLLDEARLEQAIRLVGLSVSQLEPSGRQLELFAEGAGVRHERIGAAVDAIVERFGKHAIGRGVAAPDKLTPTSKRKRGT